MLKRLILATALAAGLASLVSPASAQVPQVIATCGVGVSLPVGPGGRLYQDQTGILCTTAGSGGGGGGATGSVTPAGTNGTSAQAVQGIQGGVPQNAYTGQYNATLPTFTNSQVGYVALDSNGRQILAPSSTITANLGTLNGAATAANQAIMAANQNSTPAGTSATNAQGVQGVTGGVPLTNAPQDSFAPPGSPFSATTVSTLFTVDTTGYNSITTQLTGAFAATVVYETSNDSTNWTATNGATSTSGGTGPGSSNDAGPGVTRTFPVLGRYFRARVSSFTSGTVVLAAYLRAQPYAPPGQTTYVGGGNIVLQTGTANVGALGVTAAANGLTGFSRIPSSAATTNLTQAKAAAGRVYKVFACNTTTTSVRIKFYNALSANVTVGTTAPLLTRPIPAAAAAGGLACSSYDWADIGAYFSTGISYAIVTGGADNDATAAAAGAVTDLSVEYQ